MNLAIFDLDGTLMDTVNVDAVCFAQAITDVTGVQHIDLDWSTYGYSTDSGLISEIFRERIGRLPSHAELIRVQWHFVARLTAAFVAKPQICYPLPGAIESLKTLQMDPNWGIALATDGWAMSARLKLRRAKLPLQDIPSAFADDDVNRAAILRQAISRAEEAYHQDSFDHIVYVGDGIWDFQAARQLDIGFLGLDRGQSGARLREAGATHLISDFTNFQAMMRNLQSAISS
jgi:phosphoglycolate phosphatase-like HAD superfamily hydrolase